MKEYFDLKLGFATQGGINIEKYESKSSKMKVYFAELDSQVINGYFCFGSELPETSSVETLLYHLDSSGGLLPRAMRGEMLRPAWQFHGAENPLADRDQSCFVCCALGEAAFLGTFSCASYLLQSIDAVFQVHGFPTSYNEQPKESNANEDKINNNEAEKAEEDEEEEEKEPDIHSSECYCLSEAGEGAMAWETTLQNVFPGTRCFWNRLLNDGRSNTLTTKLRKIYDDVYRPENLTVIITGTVSNKEHLLAVLHEYEVEFKATRSKLPDHIAPWKKELPPKQEAAPVDVRFVPRNPIKTPQATICIGFRGCCAFDLVESMALKVITAHLAVNPLWTNIVTKGLAHRISWCQLEYSETCSLLTIHGVNSDENAEQVTKIVHDTMKSVVAGAGPDSLELKEIQAMIERVKWHYVRELESEPFLILASAISKADRYGEGAAEQIEKRIHPGIVFDALKGKPLDFWIELLKKYAGENDLFITRVLPKEYQKPLDLPSLDPKKQSEDASGDFVSGSRRAASRPRRKDSNAMVQESSAAVDEDGRSNNIVLPDKAKEGEERTDTLEKEKFHLEEIFKENPFPIHDYEIERQDFEGRLDVTKEFLAHVTQSSLKSWKLSSYATHGPTQHSLFPLNEMPFYTFLEDTKTEFIYLTLVLDTTSLNNDLRKTLAPLTSAIGALVCPRPPGLDTDCEIKNKNEFNPPLYLADSQVSIGLNGEMMQSIFLSIIVRPDKYEWAVGLIQFLLYDNQHDENFLKFITKEAIRGLGTNYKMQTPEEPNYECFDASEINLHGLIKQIYKDESNARLFVGRRRLDVMLEYYADLQKNPDELVAKTNKAWKEIVNNGKIVLQVSCDVEELHKTYANPLENPWKKLFPNNKTPGSLSDVRPVLEPDVMTYTGVEQGIVIKVKHNRPACFTAAIPINPNSQDFPKLCIAAQLFSMAQKWIWTCWGEEDVANPVLRMPCSYANLITLNIESTDVIGFWKVMKSIMHENWPWLSSLLVATKLMVINDPATLELGPQGSIVSALLSHLNGYDLSSRRDLLQDSMDVTEDDIKYVCRKYLQNLFDPKQTWCVLMADDEDREELVSRLSSELGYKFKEETVQELCTSL